MISLGFVCNNYLLFFNNIQVAENIFMDLNRQAAFKQLQCWMLQRQRRGYADAWQILMIKGNVLMVIAF